MPGEDAAARYVEGLAAAENGPMWLFVIGVLLILAAVVVKVLPVYRETKLKRIEIEAEREKRKAEEARMQNERERERTAIAAKQVEAQNNSTAAMNAMTAQMSVLTAGIDESKYRSREMGAAMGAMATQVDEIHGAVVGQCRVGGTD
ncbi:hypothetical protein [Raoultibacter timonensis]|uniref:hypothetical protein n=1 Tax=Raoultibacter timonensis TaxID=1907662 RepID=UPI0026DC5E5D|nr:hypothetical protein [Raoultibacter timonensis]